MIGIVITVHNRPNHTAVTLESLCRSMLNNCIIIIIDDASDSDTTEIIRDFYLPGVPVSKFRNSAPLGVKQCLLFGIMEAFSLGCTVVTNLDNDVKLKPDWFIRLIDLHSRFYSHIVTGFHSTTHNDDGSERHPILEMQRDYCVKRSVGGINMIFTRNVFDKYIKPALESPNGNWDHQACISAGEVVCAVPSLMQHTGVSLSAMGHAGTPDVADDFFELDLPEVTLVGVDCNHFPELEKAASISMLDIRFGAVKLLTSAQTHNPNVVSIPHIGSKEEYNKFIMKSLWLHVDTPHMLTIQGDGYVLNSQAWDPSWLEWDYIGATWVYKDGMNVGNGGFSLRSLRLMEILATDPKITEYMPEDHQICRTYRTYLEQTYGIRFAPEEVANRFSIEAYSCDKLQGATNYSGQFGFHGWHVDYSESSLIHVPTAPRKKKQVSGGRWI